MRHLVVRGAVVLIVLATVVGTAWFLMERRPEPRTTPVGVALPPERLKTNCVEAPSACGYPDATNSGVPDGTPLQRVPQDVTSGAGWEWDTRGWLAVTGDGAVVEYVVVEGSIEVFGDDVTVRNNRILASGETWGVGLRHATNATIENNDIGVDGAPRLLVGVKDIFGDAAGTRVLRNEIVNTSTGVQTHEGLIEGNFIHSMGYQDGDHTNGVMSNGGTEPLTIRGNTILNDRDQTCAIGLFQDFGLEANRLVTGNLLAGGGYTIYGGASDRYGVTNDIRINNNRFSNAYFPDGGSYGPYTAFDPDGEGNDWSGNIWDHSGEPVA